MYPINAASPQRIAIGPVVQISDGAVQTSGVSVKVMPQGGAASAGGGTTAYEEGIVHYLPTQAETNYASFIVIAYKTGCIPACITVVTSASGTAGYAGVDWSKVTAPTTTLNLSGTTVKTATDVETDTADIQSRLPAALVGGRIDANMGAISSDATAADNAEAFFDGTGYAGTNNVIPTVTTLTNLPAITANWLTAAGIAADAGAEIADAVWDEALSGHLSAGSTGEALNAAGAAGDPWTTSLPGAYGAGSAGYIIGNNVNATISSRASQTSVDTVDDFLDTEVAAIKAKTDLIPAAPAAVGDIPTAVQNADALLGRNVSGGSSTGRTVKQAFHFIRNKWVVSGGTLTVYDTDDSTSSWTAAVTGTAGADPVTGSDPA